MNLGSFLTKRDNMRHYELVLLVHPDQSEQVPEMINRYQETVKKSDGVIHRTEDIGRMPLAYTIEDMHKAHYVLMNIESNEGVIAELETLFKFNDSIMRHLIVKMKKAETDDSKLYELNNKKDDYKKAKEQPSIEKKEAKEDSSKDKEQADIKTEEEDDQAKTETQEVVAETEQETENATEDKVEEETDEKKEG
jgi:small subunit ribosomal protein S6|tara:strand:+ start:2372 stop:2953 length:582 start_codon:yes stop_codon:yes gene_type:complete